MNIIKLLKMCFNTNKEIIEEIENEKSITDAVVVRDSRDFFTNPPYEFTLTIKCNEKREVGKEILTFSTDNPYDIVKHTCKHCGDTHTFSAVETFKKREYSEQSLINHKDFYYGKPVMHDFKVIAPCEKLLDAEII